MTTAQQRRAVGGTHTRPPLPHLRARRKKRTAATKSPLSAAAMPRSPIRASASSCSCSASSARPSSPWS
eukprot:12239350-Ditylum_brightwellii.AAC.1